MKKEDVMKAVAFRQGLRDLRFHLEAALVELNELFPKTKKKHKSILKTRRFKKLWQKFLDAPDDEKAKWQLKLYEILPPEDAEELEEESEDFGEW